MHWVMPRCTGWDGSSVKLHCTVGRRAFNHQHYEWRVCVSLMGLASSVESGKQIFLVVVLGVQRR